MVAFYLLSLFFHTCLESYDDDELQDERGDGREADERLHGRVGVEVALVGLGEAEEKCKGGDEEEIDVEELDVGQVGFDGVEQQHGHELRQRVRRHVLENAERGHEGAAA